ncbi:MAG: 30S ribosomal protein S16 [Bacteroidetes bacterium]|jgi:small subunit ribosomal protein S16|nr:30S ribosomal protein S16 [Bacteroidota bacterium]MBT5528662.1 30S ribosomal protein S16 [Cytophagia bacterium]MBT3422613.1 30S ribosomal protein S16 [Bacteroidota bacterium]MBT3800568.1 30S ribosomal protein S16 [Bacteroidota bacterium]MBT3934393.1 30S ribosomal protein S16 [Bacteroidota bacterium]
MAVKIRLQRKGRKKAPYYYIVVADARSPRDGKFIERIGSYNPIPTIPQIDIDTDKAVSWLDLGAVPTKTVKTLLSTKGVLFKKHLSRGIKMGILTEEEAEVKFNEFIAQKADQYSKKIEKLEDKTTKSKQAALDHEAEVNKKRAAAIAAKRKAEIDALTPAEEVEEEVEATEEVVEASPETATEEVAAEVKEEVVVAEAPKEEAPVAEAKEEAVVAEAPKEEALVAEVKEEAAAEEAPKEEEKKEEADKK